MPRRQTPRWLVYARIFIALVLIGGSLAGYRACDAWRNRGVVGREPVALRDVVDGDTLWVIDQRGKEIKVRLMGIDTPELGTAASFRSALYAAEMLEEADVIWLEPDPGKPLDKYGRTLGWVWLELPGRDGEALLQEELIRAGLAELYRDAGGSKYYARLEKAR